jgi:hypothetical protein
VRIGGGPGQQRRYGANARHQFDDKRHGEGRHGRDPQTRWSSCTAIHGIATSITRERVSPRGADPVARYAGLPGMDGSLASELDIFISSR